MRVENTFVCYNLLGLSGMFLELSLEIRPTCGDVKTVKRLFEDGDFRQHSYRSGKADGADDVV